MARERWQAGVEFASLSLNEICTKHAALCGALSGCSCVWLGRPACSVQRVSSAVQPSVGAYISIKYGCIFHLREVPTKIT